ncbi:MAG: KilA-N domain-containing protein [Bacteroidia bacterium]|nr:KilA-N domain-containing protein [Bacteroidia bacterium]
MLRDKCRGLISKRGRYGGVYAQKDIAYHFGMWLSPRFSLLMITEFDRLKAEESSRQQLEWSYQRF